MENLDNNTLIFCPYCNKKYFPSEIFVPKNFLGTAFFVDEDMYMGSLMDLAETYTCDKCNNRFKVEANISFSCSELKIRNFEEDF